MVSEVVLLSGTEMSYAFMVDKSGFVAWHPALPSPVEGKLRDMSLLDLESDADFESEVYREMLTKVSGSATILRTTLSPVRDAKSSRARPEPHCHQHSAPLSALASSTVAFQHPSVLSTTLAGG